MKYEKPEISCAVFALSSIQGGTKADITKTELNSMEPQRTVPAYEADE